MHGMSAVKAYIEEVRVKLHDADSQVHLIRQTQILVVCLQVRL